MFLDIPLDVDMVIFGGDASNPKEPVLNANEVLDFLEWFNSLTHIKYKIMIAGNHDTSIENGMVSRGDIPESIIYLEHESVIIEGIKIFGSPYTPKFGTNWAYNVPRGNPIKAYWDDIPEDTQILVTHGPPKGVLDLTQYDTRLGNNGLSYFQCGCKDLLERVQSVQPAYHLFGHIHTEKNCPNSGILRIQNCSTTFINGAVVDYGRSNDDQKTKQIVNNGFIFEI
jgi:Icc-related predicted phosphoesterase